MHERPGRAAPSEERATLQETRMAHRRRSTPCCTRSAVPLPGRG